MRRTRGSSGAVGATTRLCLPTIESPSQRIYVRLLMCLAVARSLFEEPRRMGQFPALRPHVDDQVPRRPLRRSAAGPDRVQHHALAPGDRRRPDVRVRFQASQRIASPVVATSPSASTSRTAGMWPQCSVSVRNMRSKKEEVRSQKSEVGRSGQGERTPLPNGISGRSTSAPSSRARRTPALRSRRGS